MRSVTNDRGSAAVRIEHLTTELEGLRSTMERYEVLADGRLEEAEEEPTTLNIRRYGAAMRSIGDLEAQMHAAKMEIRALRSLHAL